MTGCNERLFPFLLMTMKTALALAILPAATAFSAAVPALRGLTATTFLISPASVANLPNAATMPDVDAIFFMSQANYQAPDAMIAIHWLMAATVIATFLASSEIARTFKVQSGILLHSDHSEERAQHKNWMAGASLPTFEELAGGCYVIAQDAAETG